MTIRYFENDFHFTEGKGEENLACYKYNDTTLCHRFCCKKCHDMVLVDHPYYRTHVTAAVMNVIVDSDYIPNKLRWCVGDCPESEKDRITTYPYEFGDYMNCSEETMAKVHAKGEELGYGDNMFNFAVPPSTKTGTNVQELAERIGVTNLGLKSRMQTPLLAALAKAAAEAEAKKAKEEEEAK